MPGGKSIRIATVAGIPVGIHPLWLLIVGLITWSLAVGYFPERIDDVQPGVAWALGLISALLLFASVVLHEFGHAITAQRYGMKVDGIDLWLLGGVAKMRGGPDKPRHEIGYALAGPAVTLVVAVTFAVVAVVLSRTGPDVLWALAEYQAIVNTVILVFNMLPAFPLDGGRVTRALIWRRNQDKVRATATAARVGRWFAYGMIAFGVFSLFAGAPGGLWFALIGFFLIVAGGAEAQQIEIQELLAGRHAEDLMSSPAISVPADISIQDAIENYFAEHRFISYPVVENGGDAVGLLSLEQVQGVPDERRRDVLVGDVAERSAGVFVDADDDLGRVLERPGLRQMGRVVVRDDAGHTVGILSMTDLERTIKMLRLVGPRRRA